MILQALRRTVLPRPVAPAGAMRRLRFPALVLLASAPALAIVATRAVHEEASRAAALREQALGLARAAAGEQEEVLVRLRAALETLAEVPAVRDAQEGECHAMLSGVARRAQVRGTWWVIGRDGAPLCSSRSAAPPAHLTSADRSYFRAAMAGQPFVLSEHLARRDQPGSALVAAVPVRGPGGDITAVLAATIEAPRLGVALDAAVGRAATGGLKAMVLLLDSAGTVVAWRTGARAAPPRAVSDAGVTAPARPDWTGMSIGGLALHAGGRDEADGLAEGPGPDGVDRVWGFARVPGTGARVLVGFARADLAGPVRAGVAWTLAVVAMAAVLVALAVRWRACAAVGRGARSLAALAERIGIGDLRAGGAPAVADPALKVAADAMDAMARRLAAREAALRESEGFLRSVMAAATDCVEVVDAAGRLQFINARGVCLLGLADAGRVLGRPWPARWPAAGRDAVEEAVARALDGGGIQRFEGFCPAADGSARWWDVVVTTLEAEAGAPPRLLAVSRDVTERRAAEERQAQLVREVDHRAKNALAVALSLVRLAPRDDARRFAAGVEGRIAAMARAHSLLARERWGGADLRALAAGELAAHAGRVRLDGPPARVAADAAQPVAMILHELATNAARHGALAAPGGALDLRWDFEGEDGGLRLHWTERGGPALAGPPARKGFGTQLLASLAERQLGGRLEVAWRPEGLRLVLALAPRRVAPAGPGWTPAAPEPDAVAAPAPPDPPTVPSASDGAPRPRVLVAEDDTLLALELEAALRRLGCDVVGPARTVAEALRLIRGEPVLHAAVLDVNLAGELVFPAADLLATRGVPTLFATGYGSAEALAGREAGAVAVLRKPYPQDALAGALARALDGARG